MNTYAVPSARPVIFGMLAFGLLIAVYFGALTLISGWTFTLAQFAEFWYYILPLGAGFGVQVALYSRMRQLLHQTREARMVMAASGATSTAAMISCCAHYLVNIAPVLGATGLVAAPSAEAVSNLPPKSSSQAGVAVQVTPRVISGSTWEFEFAINTHSGDLSEDLEKAVVLVADGRASYTPVAWQGDPPGGHHRTGVLRFRAISPQPQAIEIKLQRPGEPSPRLFHWQVR